MPMTYSEQAKKLINEHQYLMLSKSWCPDCHYTYDVFRKFGVYDKIHIIELDKYEDQTDAVELEKAFTDIVGKKWVPSLFFNSKFIGTEQDLKTWSSQNTLSDIFKEAGLIE